MADVENHSPLLSISHRVPYLTLLVQNPTLHVVVAVGENVAPSHNGEDVVKGVAPGRLWMDHDRQAGGICRFTGVVQWDHAGALADDAVLGQPDLDAQYDVPVSFDHPAAGGYIGELGYLELAYFATDHALTGDVEMREDAGLTDVDDVLAKTGKGVGSCRTGVHHGCGAACQAGRIRLDAEVADAGKHMHV